MTKNIKKAKNDEEKGASIEHDDSDDDNNNDGESGHNTHNGATTNGGTQNQSQHTDKITGGTLIVPGDAIEANINVLKQHLIKHLQKDGDDAAGSRSDDFGDDDRGGSSSMASEEIRHLVDDVLEESEGIVTPGGSEDLIKPDNYALVTVHNIPRTSDPDGVINLHTGSADVDSESASSVLAAVDTAAVLAPKTGSLRSPAFRPGLLEQVRIRSSLFPQVREHEWHSLPLNVAKSWPIHPSASTAGHKSPAIVTDQGHIIS